MLEGDRLYKEIAKRREERKNKASGKFDKKKLSYKQTGGDKLEFKTPELRTSELERLKADIRSKIKNDNLKDYVLFLGIFLVLFVLLYFLMDI